MRIYTETPFRMTPPRMAVVMPFEPSSLWIAPNPGPIAREALEAIGLPSDGDEIRIEAEGDVVTVNGARGHEDRRRDRLLRLALHPERFPRGPVRGIHPPGPPRHRRPSRHREEAGGVEVMSESIEVASRRIPLRRMGVREVVERMERATGLATEFEATYRDMSPFVASLAFLQPDDAGPNRKARRAAEAKARRRA